MQKLTSQELSRLTVEDFKKAPKTPIYVILDNVRSLNNIGSVFRTCDAFAIKKLLLCGITATPPHKDINRTALGATESVLWEHYPTTAHAIDSLKKEGVKIIAVEQVKDSISLETFSPAKDTEYALVFGNEVFGVEQEVVDMCDMVLEVPQEGTKHSLNIAVCAGVVLWDLYAKIKYHNK
ncbi:MAG: RNA methyltransferase [Flavobacteriales bacterium]|nr:RNA methyltransferase [Flavobacteriales bacterium]